VSGVLQSKERVKEMVETGLFQCDGFDGDMTAVSEGRDWKGFEQERHE
jgi:hypothetical protein